VHFDFREQGFGDALRHKDSGAPLEREIVWSLLTEFFDHQMLRQNPIAGALEAMGRLSQIADIVVLTNIGERHHQLRIEQLAAHDVTFPVFWNEGGKGRQLAAILADRQPSVALFVDDLGHHHQSVAKHAPEVWRLHFVGEPEVAPHIAPAPEAHARIDDWATAERWIAERIVQGPAPAISPAIDGVTP
jgi:hypothetical protein